MAEGAKIAPTPPGAPSRPAPYSLLWFGATLALLGYFLPWWPHPAAGLRLIGLEIGEWVKFLPQVRDGQVAPGRDLFYLPPVTLGLVLAAVTARWPNRRWQTWAMRGLACAVSLLALPSWEVIRDEPSGQWLPRLVMIAVVLLVALAMAFGRRLPPLVPPAITAATALAGALLPSWAYLEVRPLLSELLRASLGLGIGVWLNFAGHLLIAAVALRHLAAGRAVRRPC